MKRAGLLLAVILLAASCATMSPPQGQDLVNRAVKAVGGADALAGVKTLSVEGTVRQWEPEQSMAAGGEMRFACGSTFVFVTDVASGATRIDWVRNFQYPAPRTFTFQRDRDTRRGLRRRHRQQWPHEAEPRLEPAGSFDVGPAPGHVAA